MIVTFDEQPKDSKLTMFGFELFYGGVLCAASKAEFVSRAEAVREAERVDKYIIAGALARYTQEKEVE